MASPTRSASYWLRKRLGISEVRREKFVLATKRIGEIWSSVVHHRMGQLGVGLLVFFVTVALIAPLLAPWDPQATVDEQLVGPRANEPIARNASFQLWDAPPKPLKLTLYGNASRGWGFSNETIAKPGPSVVVLLETSVTLELIGNDSSPHRWFLDYNNSLTPDPDNGSGEPISPRFNDPGGPVVTFTFVANRVGNWTYRCEFHPTSMTGSFEVTQQTWTDVQRAQRADDKGAGAHSNRTGQAINATGFSMRIFRDAVDSVGLVALLDPNGTDPGQFVGVRVSFDGGLTWSSKYEIRTVAEFVEVNLTGLTTWTVSKLNTTNLVVNITHESDPGTSGLLTLDYIGVTVVWRTYWHLFGTDQNGRDIFSRVIWGSRVSLMVGFLSSVIAGVLGTLVGLVSGYFGGWKDEILMRINDILLSLPWLALLIVLAAILGGQLRIEVIIVTIGLTSWSFTARVVRAQVLSVKERVFVERAKASGASNLSILRKHIFPNVFPLVFANTILTVAVAILSESTLAFLGKVQPGTLSWGVILHEAEATGAILNGRWEWIVIPGLALVVVIFGFALLGNALDEILNPKLRER